MSIGEFPSGLPSDLGRRLAAVDPETVQRLLSALRTEQRMISIPPSPPQPPSGPPSVPSTPPATHTCVPWNCKSAIHGHKKRGGGGGGEDDGANG